MTDNGYVYVLNFRISAKILRALYAASNETAIFR